MIIPYLSCISSSKENNTFNPTSNSKQEKSIVNVNCGPLVDFPAVMVVTCLDGSLYVYAFPDYIQWDRLKNRSIGTKVVGATIQVLKGIKYLLFLYFFDLFIIIE